MATVVYTETTCDRCGIHHRTDGREQSVPPVGWSVLTLAITIENFRRDRGCWSVGSVPWEVQLCPDCTAHVRKAAGRLVDFGPAVRPSDREVGR